MPAPTVNAAEFAAHAINASYQQPVLVYFWADWCAPCRMVSPILNDLHDDTSVRVAVVKVNADLEQSLVRAYGVSSIPTLLLFNRGSLIKTIVGARNKLALMKELDGFV